MKNYKILEDVAIADVAFEATGNNLDEVFEACADATFDVMVDVNTVKDKEFKEISLVSDNAEDLLFEFLEEIILIKDRDYFIFNRCEVKIKEEKDKIGLTSKFFGETINAEKQDLKVDVKAVTLHMFSLKKKDDNYVATVVLDI
jgi:SHS2 domain-containing protein